MHFVTRIRLVLRMISDLQVILRYFLGLVYYHGVLRNNSSTEAEYQSLAIVTVVLYWLRMLFKDLHIPLLSPPIIWCNNVGTFALASNPIYHARTKHIEVDYHFIREEVLNKDIVPKYISTVDQVVDVFTKGLSAIHLSQLCTKLHVHHIPLRLRGLLSKIYNVADIQTQPIKAKHR